MFRFSVNSFVISFEKYGLFICRISISLFPFVLISHEISPVPYNLPSFSNINLLMFTFNGLPFGVVPIGEKSSVSCLYICKPLYVLTIKLPCASSISVLT